MFDTKIVDKIKTQFSFQKLPPPENPVVYEMPLKKYSII
jgi:hypothetical protein